MLSGFSKESEGIEATYCYPQSAIMWGIIKRIGETSDSTLLLPQPFAPLVGRREVGYGVTPLDSRS
jgi:hypothetical protein